MTHYDASLDKTQFEANKTLGSVKIDNLTATGIYQLYWINSDLFESWEMGREEPCVIENNSFYTGLYILDHVDSSDIYFSHPTMEHSYLVLSKSDYNNKWFCKNFS
jgi:hypothetical protein